ncbi:MAG: YdcF family protein [Alphaproteobacteria bacterium]
MWLIPGSLKTLLFPPANLFLVVALGWLLGRRWPRLGGTLVKAALIVLFLLSLPAVAGTLLRAVESVPPLEPGNFVDEARAIVVLSAGIYRDAPEYGGDTVDPVTLERLRYGAWLHRATGLPLLVTGGQIKPGDTPLARVMAATLRNEFGVPVRWVEPEARNTFDNAERSASMLRRAEGIDKVYLVTSAAHMRRALAAFAAVGLNAVPAPTNFASPIAPEFSDFIPSAEALRDCTTAFYEALGLVWYRLAYL